jgi:HSP20 family molecular chaperone IbpA
MREHFMFDMGQVMDQVFEAAQKFKDAFKDGFPKFDAEGTCGFKWDENTDFYPLYSYPPSNVYMTKDRELILEFALAGFEEKDVDLQFQGDYLVLSAKPEPREQEEGVRYFKRRLKFREISGQKYFVPEKKFDRDKVKAVFRNGILKVTVPPREGYTTGEGVKVKIVREGK